VSSSSGLVFSSTKRFWGKRCGRGGDFPEEEGEEAMEYGDGSPIRLRKGWKVREG
jgi:hypothetical protein